VKPPEKALKRWLHPFVFATWSGFLVYILAGQCYVVFLRPEIGLLLALAYFIAMGLMIAAMIRPKTKQIDIPAVFRALVLLVPVFYFVAMPDAMLGNQTFKRDSSEPQTAVSASERLPCFRHRGPKTILVLRHFQK
jgi:hypothetical protein